MQQKLKELNYCDCEVPGHETEPLCRVCIDKNCQNKTLICAICQEESHKGHQTMPMKIFLKKIYGTHEKKSNEKEKMSAFYYAQKIQQTKSMISSQIQQFRNEMSQSLDKLQMKTKLYFNSLTQKVASLIQMQNPIQVIQRKDLKQTNIKKYFQLILKNIKVDQKFSLSEKLLLIMQQSQKKQKILNANLQKMTSSTTNLTKKINQAFDAGKIVFQKLKFEWSEDLKGTKMKIAGPRAQQTGNQSSGQRFILMDQSLTDANSSKICWAIKVIKFVGWIGIGICLKNVISKANFFFHYSNLGHGSYMISNNGYSWSHSIVQFNSAHKTFHFSVGDIIYVEYDKTNKKLRFQKNITTNKFQLDVADPPEGDSYYPCANICSCGDAVQIINSDISLS